MKSFHKTSSGKWRKKMRACSTVPTTNQIFGSWECQCECWDSHLPQRVCVCVRLSFLTVWFQLWRWYSQWLTRRTPVNLICGVFWSPGGLTEGQLRQARAVWGQRPARSSAPILAGAACPSYVLPWGQNCGQKSREVFFRIVQALLWELLE